MQKKFPPPKKTNLWASPSAPVLWPPSDLDVEKYVEGKKEEKEERRKRRIMPSLVATTSTPARKPCVSTHYVRTNNIIGVGLVIRYLGHNLVTRVSYIVLVHNGGVLVLVHSGGVLVLDHNGGVLVVVPSGGVWG